MCERRSDGRDDRRLHPEIMALADGYGLPLTAWVDSATPHETRYVEPLIEKRWIKDVPQTLIGDKAYDSDPLDARLREKYGIALIAPHKVNRKKPQTQDGRCLRRYKHRWEIERLFAWLQNFRRLVTRYERHLDNFRGFVHLGCLSILLRYF